MLYNTESLQSINLREMIANMLLIKGILIGIFVTLPVGPLGLLAVQRTINKGWKIGFLAAMGAAASDLIYSSIAILGISFIDEFINRNANLINGLTGTMFLIVGINIFISGMKNFKVKEVEEDGRRIHPFYLHFLLGLSNPMTFIIFLTIFSRMGIYVELGNAVYNFIFIVSIFVGACILWFSITHIIEKNSKKFNLKKFIFLDKIIGMAICLFGVFSIIKTLL